MYRSHQSYGERCGLGTPGDRPDRGLLMARERGPTAASTAPRSPAAARGGTVAVLGAGAGAAADLEAVAAAYARRSGNRARVISGSGDGALALPVLRLRSDREGGCPYEH